jgi:hypothetical protein
VGDFDQESSTAGSVQFGLRWTRIEEAGTHGLERLSHQQLSQALGTKSAAIARMGDNVELTPQECAQQPAATRISAPSPSARLCEPCVADGPIFE